MLVHVACAGCGIQICVFPHLMLDRLPEDARGPLELELADAVDDEGRRYAIADDRGFVSCPDCGDALPLPAAA